METIEILVVLSTFPDAEQAVRVGRTLVEEKLAACAQVEQDAMRSLYHWEGALHDEPENLVRLKCAPERGPALTARLEELHPYDVPQIVILTAQASAAYGAWVRIQCGLEGPIQG